MKILRQFGLILAITFAGEVLKALLPLPIPASIYGMVIMRTGQRIVEIGRCTGRR